MCARRAAAQASGRAATIGCEISLSNAGLPGRFSTRSYSLSSCAALAWAIFSRSTGLMGTAFKNARPWAVELNG